MTRWFATFAAAALALSTVAVAQNAKPDPGSTASQVAPDAFVRQALQSGEKEQSLAELAVSKSKNASVTEFARMIADDHRRVNEQLRLALQQGAGPDRKATDKSQPGSPPAVAPGAAPTGSPEHKKLEGLTGAAFDKAFTEIMVEGHTKSVALYEDAAQSLPAGAAKKLAEDTLPKIKQHLEQAKSLNGALDGDKKN